MARRRINLNTAQYGSFSGSDPRDFFPDPECSTVEERDFHAGVCDMFDRFEELGYILPTFPSSPWKYCFGLGIQNHFSD